MSKVTTYKCDRCATLIEDEADRIGLRMTASTGVYEADLDKACFDALLQNVTFTMKAKRKGRTTTTRTPAAAGAAA